MQKIILVLFRRKIFSWADFGEIWLVIWISNTIEVKHLNDWSRNYHVKLYDKYLKSNISLIIKDIKKYFGDNLHKWPMIILYKHIYILNIRLPFRYMIVWIVRHLNICYFLWKWPYRPMVWLAWNFTWQDGPKSPKIVF